MVMNKKPPTALLSSQQKLTLIVISCFGALALVYLIFIADQSVLSIMKKKYRLEILEKEKSSLIIDNSGLAVETERAKNDLEYIESIARERNMLKKNELIIDLTPKSKR